MAVVPERLRAARSPGIFQIILYELLRSLNPEIFWEGSHGWFQWRFNEGMFQYHVFQQKLDVQALQSRCSTSESCAELLTTFGNAAWTQWHSVFGNRIGIGISDWKGWNFQW